MAKARFILEGEVGEVVLTDPPLNLFGLEFSRIGRTERAPRA
jgi:hypothetical protein